MQPRTLYIEGEKIQLILPDWYVWEDVDTQLWTNIIKGNRLYGNFGETMGKAMAKHIDEHIGV